MSIMNSASDAVNQGTGMLRTLWNSARGTLGVLAVSTMVAAATGGISLTASAAAAAGSSVAATTGAAATIPFTPSVMLDVTMQGVKHNLGGLASLIPSPAVA